MSVLDRFRNGHEPQLRETVRRQKWQMELMEESIRTLETTLSGDSEWRRMGMQVEREFSRSGLDDLVKLSRAMYLSHPLIQRAVNVTTYYTWGQGVEFVSESEAVMDRLVTPMLDDPRNRAEIFSHQARLLTDVDQLVDGNTFTALAVDVDPVQVRSIPTEEIRCIHCNPDDYRDVWFYRRSWAAEEFDRNTGETRTVQREALYPDVNNVPAAGARPDSIGGVEVRWDAPVLHQKVGGLKHMQFGMPATYAALDWARAYRKFLEDWHTIVSSLARFAWTVTTKGSKVDAMKRKLGTRTTELGEGTDRPPPAGNMFIGTADDTLTPVPKTGAHTSSEDARPSRLMVGAAMDLPDTILSGDADVGNLATAKTLDRPTELAMRSRQALWGDWHQSLFAAAGVWTGGPVDAVVQAQFPPILEHDPEAAVRALVSAATLDGKIEAGTIPHDELAKQLMSAVGVEDVQDALDNLETEDRVAAEQAVEKLRGMIGDLSG